MLWCQVRIAHGHGQAGVAQDFLQREDVPALLHEVAGKGVPECVAGLPFRQDDA